MKTALPSNLTLLLFSSLLSGVGTGITLIGVNWKISEHYGDSTTLGYAAIASQLLIFFSISPFSSMIKGISKKKAMLGICLAGFLFQSAFSLSSWGVEESGLLLVSVSIIAAVLRAFDQNTRIAFTKNVVTESQILYANKQLELCRQAITFISGGCSVWLLESYSFSALLAIDAATYFLAFLLIYAISYREQLPQLSPLPSPENTASKSATLSSKAQNIPLILVLSLIPYASVLALNSIYPIHFSSYLNAGSEEYSALTIIYGLGAIVFVLLAPKAKSFQKYISVLMILFAAACFCMSIKSVPLSFLMIFLFAGCHSLVRVLRNSHIMKNYSQNEILSIGSYSEMFVMLLNVILTLLITHIADNLDIKWAWYAMSLVQVLAVALLVFSKFSLLSPLSYLKK